MFDRSTVAGNAGPLGLAAAVLLAIAAAMPAAAQTAVPPPLVEPGFSGIWVDDTGEGAIEISACGERLCGRIVWLKKPTDRTGRPLTDGYNPEAGKRNRPICGLPVIGDLKRQANGAWDAGWISLSTTHL